MQASAKSSRSRLEEGDLYSCFLLMPFCVPARGGKDGLMKDEIFSVLQRVGRSFMLPVAVLPIAGILLGIGASFTNPTTIKTYGLEAIFGDGTLLGGLLTIMASAGSTIFGNLPIIFAVGVAIGMAKAEREVAALAAMISFFVMHSACNAIDRKSVV